MLNITDEEYAGLECVKFDNGLVSLWITKCVGPRILGFAITGKESLLAILPDQKFVHSNGDVYYFRGGHRLWYAPEAFNTTYIPDNQPVNIRLEGDTLLIEKPADVLTGIQKTLLISLPHDKPEAKIDHQLSNIGENPFTLAPWAITQLKPGGFAILPQNTGNADSDGLLPNRKIVFWPYTKLNSPSLQMGDKFIFVQANMEQGAIKIGYPNPKGWLAYQFQDTLFIKKSEYFPQAEYYDLGSSSECYCNPDFLELETLGPKMVLEPGQMTSHKEEWTLFDQVQFTPDEESAAGIYNHL